MVFALFEGDWFRARVMEPHTQGTVLQYIDYGNVATVDTKEMLPMPFNMKFDICARDFVVDSKCILIVTLWLH